MKIKNTLHKISKFKWFFLALQILLILYCFIALPDNLLSLTGLILYFAGIQLGLDSLSDVEKMSEKEKKQFQSETFLKRITITIFSMIGLLVLISLLFISLKLIFGSANNPVFVDLFDLGIDCWALILGLLCLLKQ